MDPIHRHRRIAIVGCGYVGTAVGRRLIADGFEVLGTTTTPSRCDALSRLGIDPAVVEIGDVKALHALFTTGRSHPAGPRGLNARGSPNCDVVVVTLGAGGRRRGYREVYADGAANMVAALGGSPVRRLIYTSSTRVYNEDEGGWVDESSPISPVDDNTAALIEAERTFLERGREQGLAVSVLRLGGIHGPGRDLDARIQLAAGTTRRDGGGFVNLVHVGDIVEVLARLIVLDHHGTLNVTDGVPTPRRELYDRVLAERALPPIHWAGEGHGGLGKRVCNRRVVELLGISFRAAGGAKRGGGRCPPYLTTE